MKRTKKMIAWATVLAMAVVPAATSRADENTDASENAFAKYDETVEISSVKNLGASGLDFPEGDSLEDNVWSRYLEETLNIKLNWLWSTNSEQYPQKVNIAITSDDIPDVMQVSASQLKMMYDNGQIMDITDAMKTWRLIQRKS